MCCITPFYSMLFCFILCCTSLYCIVFSDREPPILTGGCARTSGACARNQWRLPARVIMNSGHRNVFRAGARTTSSRRRGAGRLYAPAWTLRVGSNSPLSTPKPARDYPRMPESRHADTTPEIPDWMVPGVRVMVYFYGYWFPGRVSRAQVDGDSV